MSLKFKESITVRLFQTQQTFNKIHVCRTNFALFSHVSFAFGRFLCEDVALEGFLKGNLSGARYFKTLFGT
jgi:hypothetical protein